MASKKSKFQKFIVETINRQEIQNADYNPRIIDESAKKKLKAALKKHGLVEPIIWNKKTGNLVGGHQRLEALDALEGRKDYELDVSVIFVDPKEEAALNVQLNNPSIQGDWDLDKLMDLSFDFDLSMTDDFGFSESDVAFMFGGDDRFSELFETPESEKTKEEIEKIRAARADGKEKLEERNKADFYSVLVFESEDAKKEFYKKINTPLYEEYLSVETLERLKN